MKKLTLKEFIEKAKKVHNNKYDYSLVEYKNSTTKIKIICPIHGEFMQTSKDHLAGKGCILCGGHKKSSLEEFISRAKKVHGNKYDYSKARYINAKKPICITCPKHGDFWQTPDNHIRGQGCKLCANNAFKKMYKKEQALFISKAIEIHGNKYDYSLVDYVNNKTAVKIICLIHGIFMQPPITHYKSGCPKCCSSHGEEKILNYLNNKDLKFFKEYKFDDLFDKRRLSFDFYLPEYKLLIEYNGIQHYKNVFNKQRKKLLLQKHHDWLKRKYAKENGYRLLTIPYWEYDNIENIIMEELDKE